MGIDLSTRKYKTFVGHQEHVDKVLDGVGLGANSNQFGVAAAVLLKAKTPRMLLSVPSGKGKSRIIAAIITLQAEFSDKQHFTIVYSSRLLMSANEKRYKDLAIVLGKPIE